MAELIAALREEPRPIDGASDGVWPENVPTVAAFLAVSTQWRLVPAGGGGAAGMMGGVIAPVVPFWIGLDYSAVRAGLDAEAIAVTPELWRGLRIMEDEAAAAMNEGEQR